MSQQFKDARPSREWTSFAEYQILDSSVDHTVPGIAEARRLLIDQNFFEAHEVDYRMVLDHYWLYLRDVGKATAQEFQRQIVTERQGGFNKPPSELAREVRRAHVARYGAANFRAANELLYDLLVAPWGTVDDLKRRESDLRWDLQPQRFSDTDQLNEIARKVDDMESRALREETNAMILKRDSQLQQQILGAHKETRYINGQHRPRCDVCTALGETDQFHNPRYCPTRKAVRAGKQRAVEDDRKPRGGPAFAQSERAMLQHSAAEDADVMFTERRSSNPRPSGTPLPNRETEECWNCKKKGHRYTACPQAITDESCLRRLRLIEKEREIRKWYLGKHPLQASANTQSVAEGGDSPSVSILKRSDQASSSKASLAVKFAGCDPSDEEYWLSSSNMTTRASMFPAPAAASPASRAPAVPARQRGRPRVLPPGTAQDPGVRMQQPGWDAQRERLNRLPQGFAPSGAVSQPAEAAAPVQRDQEAIDIRTQQLLHALRSAFQFARFPSLATTAVTDGGEQQMQRWITAREAVLQGRLDQRDHCAVAWQAVVDDVVRRFFAQAKLTWADLSQINLQALCGEAVRSVYGVELRVTPTVVPPPQRPPVTPTQSTAPVSAPQPAQNEEPAEGTPAPAEQEQAPADEVDDIVGDYLERLRQWSRQQEQEQAPPTEEGNSMAMTVLDLSDRQPLPENDSVMEQRKRLIADQRQHPTVRRRWLAMVDTDITRVRVGRVEISLALLDSGCDWLSIHADVAVKAGYTYAADGRVSVQGATGVMMANRTQQPVTISFNPGINWSVEWTVPSAVVHSDDNLPEVIVDTGTLSAMMGVIHFGKWQLTYPVEPEHMVSGGGAHAVVPLTPVQPDALRKTVRQLHGATELGGGRW